MPVAVGVSGKVLTTSGCGDGYQCVPDTRALTYNNDVVHSFIRSFKGPAIDKEGCSASLAAQCKPSSSSSSSEGAPERLDAVRGVSLMRDTALYYGLKLGNMSSPHVAERLPDLSQDLSNFLLVRFECSQC